MKKIGLVGGIAPESTIDYYRRLLAGYRELRPDDGQPAIIINSIDLNKMLGLVGAGQLEEMTEYLAHEVGRLAKAGVEVGALASNTPHIVFDGVARRSPIPLVSIVEATVAKARALGVKRLGLFGTRFTMQGRFYPEAFSREGLAIVVPQGEELDFVHDKYINELAAAKFLPETRESLLAIAKRMKERDGIEALILGGTELPLLLTDSSPVGIPFLDTTQIHVAAILERALG
ncbi:MAG TPA: amino acid racemase [Candidatus Angelobacter sp.]|jgi:aspartate racemase